ncbi:MAG: hypothetical protein ACOH1K_06225, partial [Rhodoglobus sp.]
TVAPNMGLAASAVGPATTQNTFDAFAPPVSQVVLAAVTSVRAAEETPPFARIVPLNDALAPTHGAFIDAGGTATRG